MIKFTSPTTQIQPSSLQHSYEICISNLSKGWRHEESAVNVSQPCLPCPVSLQHGAALGMQTGPLFEL